MKKIESQDDLKNSEFEKAVQVAEISQTTKPLVSIKEILTPIEDFAGVRESKEFRAIKATSARGFLDRKLISDCVYQQLPDLLRKECYKFKGKERDIFFLSTLSLISAILERVYGVYKGRKLYSNMYFYLIGNPATGKGTMMYAKEAGEILHKSLMAEESQEAVGLDNLVRPKTLFIPGNSSNAALIASIDKNNGRGIIFETESDTLAAAMKQDWGGFSDLLRKAFHHEPISDNKNSGNGFVEISSPKLTAILSGTPNQVTKLMESVEDGLFSRMAFYFNPDRGIWADVFETTFHPDYYKKKFGAEVMALHSFYKDNDGQKEIEFRLNPFQKQLFNTYFSKKVSNIQKCYTLAIDASAFRLAVISYRIAMILTCIRSFESKNESSIMYCKNSDLRSALQISSTLFEHTLDVIKLLPSKEVSTLGLSDKKLLRILPSDREISTAEIVALGKTAKIPERTSKHSLKNLLDKGILKQEKRGKYFKVG